MSFNSKTLDGAFDVEADNLVVNESTDLKGTSLIEGDAIFLQEVSLANAITNSIIQLSAVNAAENYSLNLPSDGGTAGQILSTNGLGDASWLDPPTGVGTVSYIGIATVPPFLYVNGVSTAGTYTSETFSLSMTTITTDYGGTGLAVVGTAGQVLTSNGTTLGWQTPTVGTVTSFSVSSVPAFLTASLTNPTTTPALTLAYSGTAIPTSSGGTGLTTVGTEGQIFTIVSGIPAWSSLGIPGLVAAVTATSPLASTGGSNPNIYISSFTGLGPVVLQSLPTISSIKQYLNNSVSSEVFTISGVYNYPAVGTLSATTDSIQLTTTSITQKNNANSTGNIYLNSGAFKEVPILYTYIDIDETVPVPYILSFTSYQAAVPLNPLQNIPTSRLLNISGKLAVVIQNPETYNLPFFIDSAGAYSGVVGSITSYGTTYFITSVNYITPTTPITFLEFSGSPGNYPTQYTGGVIISSVLDTSISTQNDMVLTSNRTFMQNQSMIIHTQGDDNRFRVDTNLFDILASSFNFFTPATSSGGGIDSYIAGTIAWNCVGDFEATTGGAADIKAFANAKIYGGGYVDIHCKPVEVPYVGFEFMSPPLCSGDIDIRTTAMYYIPPIPATPKTWWDKVQPGSVKITSNTKGGVHIQGHTEGVSIKSKYEYPIYESALFGGPYVGLPPLYNQGINIDTGGADLVITTVNPDPGGIGAQDIGNITINSVNMFLSEQTGLVVGPSDSRISGEFTINARARFPSAIYADSAGAGVNGAWLTVGGADWKNHYSGGTCAFWSAVNFGAPRIVSDNSVTYTKAVNVFIDQPTSAGSTDLDEEYALYVNGKSYFLDPITASSITASSITVENLTASEYVSTLLLFSNNIIAESDYLSTITNESLYIYTATVAVWQTYTVGKGIMTFPIGSIVICDGFSPTTFNGTYTVTGGVYGSTGFITLNNQNTSGISIATVLGTVKSYDSSVDVLGLYTPNVDVSNLRIGQQYSNSFAISFDAIAVSLSLRPENSTIPTVTIKRSTTASLSTTTGAFVVTGDAGISGNLFAGGINLPSLTPSYAVALDSTRNIISIANTGTGNNVLATSPTISTPTLSGSVNVSGLTASRPVFTDLSNNLVSATTTGGGSVVLSSTPSLQTSFKLLGSTSGTITFTCPPAFTDYNINFPATVGTSGQVLTSGGGGITMMSWTTPTVGTVTAFSVTSVPAFLTSSVANSTTTPALTIGLSGTALPVINGGTGTTTSTGTGSVVLSTSPSITNLTTVTTTNTLYSLGVTSTVSVSHGIYQVTSPNLANGTASTMFFGSTESANNGLYASWNNSSLGSASNSYTMAVVGSASSFELTSAATFHYKPSYFSSTLALGGSTSGLITLKTQAAAGTYNWNFPTSAGVIGQVLTTGGGGSTAMSWTTASTGTVTSVAATVPAFLAITGSPITSSGSLDITLSGTALPVLNGGTGSTTSTGTGSVVLETAPTLSNSTSTTATSVLYALTVSSSVAVSHGSYQITAPSLNNSSASTAFHGRTESTNNGVYLSWNNISPGNASNSYTIAVVGSASSLEIASTATYHYKPSYFSIAGTTSGDVAAFLKPSLASTAESYTYIGRASTVDESIVLSYRHNSTAANRVLAFGWAGSSDILTLNRNGNSVSVVNAISVGGATTLYSTLDVAGITTLAARLNVTGITVLSSTLDVQDIAFVYPSGTSSGTIAGFLKPSLASGNEAYIFIGRSTSGDESVALSYRHNSTAANRVLAFGWTGQSDSLRLNRNGNSVSVVNALSVGGATAIYSTLDVSGATIISNIFRSTVNYSRYALSSSAPWPNATNTRIVNWVADEAVGETLSYSSGTFTNNLGRTVFVTASFTGSRASTSLLGQSRYWMATGITWAEVVVANYDNVSITATMSIPASDGFSIWGNQNSGVGQDFSSATCRLSLVIHH